jgi:elongation factor Ts
LVEVNCETDFVAKTDRFKSFAKMIAKQVVEANPADLDALLASEIDGQTVSALQTAAVAEIGEKITIRRFARMEGAVDTYIHLGGTRGVLVQFESPSDPEAMHDVALQIAAASPVCVDVASLPQEFIDDFIIETYTILVRLTGFQVLYKTRPLNGSTDRI